MKRRANSTRIHDSETDVAKARVPEDSTRDSSPSADQRTPSLLNLQRTIGNKAVQRLLTSHADSSITESEPENLRDLRSRVSQITGTDVSNVPIEPGDAGSARAITHQGQVRLGPAATEHDVAHELTHAAQQRATSGPSIGAREAEHRADAVANTALSGNTGSVQAGRVPSAAILGAGPPYSREAITLAAPKAGASVQDLKDQLQLKIDAGDITAYSIKGVKSGDPEEKFLYNALILLANQGRWGSELDLVTSIGTGKGLVTVRFDASGKAEAELIGKSAPTVKAAFSKPKDARDALIAQFKLADVKGEKGRTWSIDELNKVLAAWGRLSKKEAAALEGYTLIRTDKLSLAGEPLQGQTTHTDEVKPGEVTAKHVREIRFADSAFKDDDKSFIGDATDAAPASFEILIHEVGHAVEAKPFDDLNAIAAGDAAKANKAKKDAHDAQLVGKKEISTALKKRFPPADLAAGQPLFNALSAAHKALQQFEMTPDAANEAAAKKAIDDRDAVKASIAKGNKVVAGLSTALAAQDAYFAALQKFRAASDNAATSRKNADALKSGANTKRLQAFVDFVVKENIPRPTAYAEKHWPSEPAEFYDEAFSLWKNDPVFFGRYSPKLKAWFDAGKHLQ